MNRLATRATFVTATLFAAATNSQVSDAAAESWSLARDRDGIQVYTRPVDDSPNKAVKATMQINATLAQLVALVQDAAACPEWAALCKKATIVEQLSESEMFVYTLNDLPWPVADRDAVTHVRWSQDPDSLAVTMHASATPDRVPEERGTVRISYAETSWIFTPAEEGRIAVTSLAHIDPAGAVPAWLTNRLLVGAPFDTMTAMRKLIEQKRYRNASFEFVREPGRP